MIWLFLKMWQFPELFLMFLPMTSFQNPEHTLLPTFPCLRSNAYYPRTPDNAYYSGVHLCWSGHSDSSFVYEFMSLDYGCSSDTEAPFLDLNLCISNGAVSTKIYDKRDDFDFDIVNFTFLDGDVPRRTSYGVYISQLISFFKSLWL